MFLQPTIKYWEHIVLFLLLSASANAQQFQTAKYNREYNPYFKFEQFNRGEKSETLSLKLDNLERKGKENWTVKDSIDFAEISLLTNNIELSHYYLESISDHQQFSRKAKMLLLMDCYLEQDFENGNTAIENHFNSESRKDRFLIALMKAHENLSENEVLDSIIFKIQQPNFSSITKGSSEFQQNIIAPLKDATEVLRFFVRFIHEDDPVIARAFNEIGIILEQYVSLNQSYVAYSIARIYNNKDKEVLENVKRIKAKHVKRNYNTPKFRTYFPRIEYWRFDYEILKEKVNRKKNDTIPKYTPNLLAAEQKKEYPFPIDILIPAGIAVILFLFIILTRARASK